MLIYLWKKKKHSNGFMLYIYIYIYESRAQGNPAGHMSSAASPDSFKMESQSSMNMEMEPLKRLNPIRGLNNLLYHRKALEELGDGTSQRLNPIRGLNNLMYHGKALEKP